MATCRFPCRVKKGTNGPYYWADGVNEMTELIGGSVGGILVGSGPDGFDAQTVFLSTAQFDDLQEMFTARRIVRNQQIAAAVNGP